MTNVITAALGLALLAGMAVVPAAAVADRFESIFNIEMYYTINTYTSVCDDCKIDQFGAVTYATLDSPCNHSTSCAQTEKLRDDLLVDTGRGDDITSIVIWTGHRMADDEGDRSNYDPLTHSVVITRTYNSGSLGRSSLNRSESYEKIYGNFSVCDVPDVYVRV
jgi:hypothetical protein